MALLKDHGIFCLNERGPSLGFVGLLKITFQLIFLESKHFVTDILMRTFSQ